MGYRKESAWLYTSLEFYVEVDKPEEWKNCPKCGLKPLIWEFDNGRKTSCGCGKNNYERFGVHAESIKSSIINSDTGTSMADYDSNGLRDNWNHWVETGEEKFVHASKRTDGRW